MAEERNSPIASPCVRICCLDDNDICLGCFRHIGEITGWGAAGDDQRRAILQNARQRRLTKQKSRGRSAIRR